MGFYFWSPCALDEEKAPKILKRVRCGGVMEEASCLSGQPSSKCVVRGKARPRIPGAAQARVRNLTTRT